MAVPCVQGQYDEAAQEGCLIGCHDGACVLVNQLAAGDSHSCAVLSDGTVRCWGENTKGQLGQGNTTDDIVKPVPVMGVNNAIAIAVSGATSCVLDEAKSVRCWGSNDHAQTSDTDGDVSPLPVTVPLKRPARKVALGTSHGCALLNDNSVACWGRGQLGQLGEGNSGSEFQTPLPVPVTMLGSEEIIDIALGGDRSCVLYKGGVVACWGAALATGETFAGAASPKEISAVTTEVLAITVGPDELCVTVSGQVVLCAGANDKGQLGHGDVEPSSTFVPVQGVDGKPVGGAIEVALGLAFGCLRQQASLQCWGDNESGQLSEGVGSILAHARPIDALKTDSLAVATGRQHACAIGQQRRRVQCWGANDMGQTGHGKPAPVSDIGSVEW